MNILIFRITCRVTTVLMADKDHLDHEVIRYVVPLTVTKLVPRSGMEAWEWDQNLGYVR